MIQVILNNLKEIQNPVAENLVNLITNKTEEVTEGFYEETIWGSKENYAKFSPIIISSINSNFGKPLVETPLTFIRGNIGPVFNSRPGYGTTFGTVLVDYISKKPLLLIIIDKSGTKFSYTSVKFEKENNRYISLTNKSKEVSDIKDLSEFIYERVSEDIFTFIK